MPTRRQATFALLLAACGAEDAPQTPEPQREQEAPPAPRPPADPSSPEHPMYVLFDAAESGNLDPLVQLCDPTGGNDAETSALCGLGFSRTHEQRMAFYATFRGARLTGTPRIEGDRAHMTFVDGAGTERTMELVRREDAYFLMSY
jgi:hypothetical protein